MKFTYYISLLALLFSIVSSCTEADLLETDGKKEFDEYIEDPEGDKFIIHDEIIDFGIIHNPYENITKSFRLSNLTKEQDFTFDIDRVLYNITNTTIPAYKYKDIEITFAGRTPNEYNAELKINGLDIKKVPVKAIVPHISANNYNFKEVKINDKKEAFIEIINNSNSEIELTNLRLLSNNNVFSITDDLENLKIAALMKYYLKIEAHSENTGKYNAELRYNTANTAHILNFGKLEVEIY